MCTKLCQRLYEYVKDPSTTCLDTFFGLVYFFTFCSGSYALCSVSSGSDFVLCLSDPQCIPGNVGCTFRSRSLLCVCRILHVCNATLLPP